MAHGVCHREVFYALDVLCEDLNLYLGQSKCKAYSVSDNVFLYFMGRFLGFRLFFFEYLCIGTFWAVNYLYFVGEF